MSVKVFLKGRTDAVVVTSANKAEKKAESRPGTRMPEPWLVCMTDEIEVARFRLDEVTGWQVD